MINQYEQMTGRQQHETIRKSSQIIDGVRYAGSKYEVVRLFLEAFETVGRHKQIEIKLQMQNIRHGYE